jgi:hypothetical protein
MKIEKIHIPDFGWYTVYVADDADIEKEVERVLRSDARLDKAMVNWVLESRKKIKDLCNE